MITLNNIRTLCESSVPGSEDDYLPGIAVEDLQDFSESAFLLDFGAENPLDESVGSEIWARIKKAFQSIINFFKMLGSKIKSFITGFFAKAKNEVDKAEKETPNEEKQDMPQEKQEEIKRLENDIKEKEQEIKETPKTDTDKIEELKEVIEDKKEKVDTIKRKYSRSTKTYRKPEEKVKVTVMYASGSINRVSYTNSIESILSYIIKQKGLDTHMYSVRMALSSDFYAGLEKHLNPNTTKDLHTERTYGNIRRANVSDMSDDEINAEAEGITEYAKAIISADIDYDNPEVLNNLKLKKNPDGEIVSYWLSVRTKEYKKSEVVSEIRNLIKIAEQEMTNMQKQAKDIESDLIGVISDINQYQNDTDKDAFIPVFKLQIQCCKKAIGIINKMTSMHVRSFQTAVQHDIQQLKRFS